MSEATTVPPASSARSRLLLFVRVVVTLGLLGWLMRGQNWPALGRVLSHARWPLLAGVWIGYVSAQAVCAWRWATLARAAGFDLPYRRFLKLYFAGMFWGNVLPTSVGGDAMRVAGLSQSREQLARAALSVLADRGLGLLFLAITALLVGSGRHSGLFWAIVSIGLGGLAVLSFAGRSPAVSRRLPDLAVFARKPRAVAGAAVLSLVFHLSAIGLHALLGAALGLPALPISAWAAAYALASLAGALPVSIGGLGVREATYTVLLTSVGVERPQAAAFAIAWYAVLVLSSVLGSLSVLLPSRPGASTG